MKDPLGRLSSRADMNATWVTSPAAVEAERFPATVASEHRQPSELVEQVGIAVRVVLSE